MNHNQIIEAWNTQADGQNQWGALGEDEKVEFAFSLGAGNLDRANALLRQALKAMFGIRDFTYKQLVAKAIAAIKQHLGDV